MYQKTVKELIDQLDDEQFIAVGSGARERKRGVPTGSGFYFIGQVKKYKRVIGGINEYYWNYYLKKSKEPEEYIPLQERMINDIWNRKLPDEPPMLAVLAEGTEAGQFALLSECDRRFKSPQPRIRDMSGFHNLRMAITQRTVEDYVNRIMGFGKTEDLDHFLESEWGELITGADGKKVEEVCRLRGRYAIWRDDHGCAKCKKQHCEHYSGEHFTLLEKGKLTCLKEEEAKDDG